MILERRCCVFALLLPVCAGASLAGTGLQIPEGWTSESFNGGVKLISSNTPGAAIYVSPPLRLAKTPLSAIQTWNDVIAPGTGGLDTQADLKISNGLIFRISALGQQGLHLERLTACFITKDKVWHAAALVYPVDKKAEATPYGRLLADFVRQVYNGADVTSATTGIVASSAAPPPRKLPPTAPLPPPPPAPVAATPAPPPAAPVSRTAEAPKPAPVAATPPPPSAPLAGGMRLTDIKRIEVIVLPSGGPTAVYLLTNGIVCACVDTPVALVNLAKVNPAKVGHWTRVQGGLRIQWPGSATFERPAWNSKPAQPLPAGWRGRGTYAVTLTKDPTHAPPFLRAGITLAPDGSFSDAAQNQKGHYGVAGYELVLTYDSGKIDRLTAVTQDDGSLWLNGQRFGLKR